MKQWTLKGFFLLLLLVWIGLQYKLYSTFESSSASSYYNKPSTQHNNIRTLSEAQSYKLTQITTRPIDTSQYTIRMNTWHRNEQLLLSLNHHAKCEGVAQIQVIWCDTINDPPNEILNHPSGKVFIEKHIKINSLNERFRILDDTPTLGILSLDDDVLRPCIALDAAFIRWTRHPERIVGFDARWHHNDRKRKNNPHHNENITDLDDTHPWEYGMTTTSRNLYSITLTSKACFVHRDYLHLYTSALPRPIYQHIDKHFECEDIALSYFVSALTGGKPPLLSDHWASYSSELYTRNGISWKVGHINSRDVCVNDFAEYLGLKKNSKKAAVEMIYPLQSAKVDTEGSFFGRGGNQERWSSLDYKSFSSPRLQNIVKDLQRRESLNAQDIMKNWKWLEELNTKMEVEAKKNGLIKGSTEWKMRWLFNCATELNIDAQTKDCFTKPTSSSSMTGFFVCDTTEGILQHADKSSSGSDWMYAGPPKGTGIHEYGAYLGDPPPCKTIGQCPQCLSPQWGELLCSVKINPEDCSITK